MIFCAKFYFSAQMAIGNANPDISIKTYAGVILEGDLGVQGSSYRAIWEKKSPSAG